MKKKNFMDISLDILAKSNLKRAGRGYERDILKD